MTTGRRPDRTSRVTGPDAAERADVVVVVERARQIGAKSLGRLGLVVR